MGDAIASLFAFTDILFHIAPSAESTDTGVAHPRYAAHSAPMGVLYTIPAGLSIAFFAGFQKKFCPEIRHPLPRRAMHKYGDFLKKYAVSHA